MLLTVVIPTTAPTASRVGIIDVLDLHTLVIPRPLCRIRQDLIGLIHCFEFVLVLRFLLVALAALLVGMELERAFLESFSYFLVVGLRTHPEDRVQILATGALQRYFGLLDLLLDVTNKGKLEGIQ